jgi:hypothetical protein
VRDRRIERVAAPGLLATAAAEARGEPLAQRGQPGPREQRTEQLDRRVGLRDLEVERARRAAAGTRAGTPSPGTAC